MLTTTLAELRAHVLRLLATATAIVLGIGFVAGTLIFGDTAKAALFDQFARAARNVAVSVTPPALAGGSTKEGQHPPVLAPPLLDAVRGVSGVTAVAGRMEEYLPLLDKRGRLVRNLDQPGVAISAGMDARLLPFDVVHGRLPAHPGEAALDADTAAHTRYAVGDRVTVLDTGQHRHDLTLVGVIGFGTSKQYTGRSVVALTAPDLTGLTGATGYRSIVVAAGSGVSEQALARNVAAAVPGAQVTTGDRYRADLANQSIKQLDPFLTAILIFAIVACVVAAFVIYNTFHILVAHRIRSLALLRCVGASRTQIFGSVLLESIVVGLIGATAGVGLGLAVAYGLFSGATALGAPLPAHRLVLTSTPFVVAFVVGVAVTACSALVPAWRATRVAPLAALRTPAPVRVGRVHDRTRSRFILVALAVLVGVLGTALTVAGLRQDNPKTATLLVVSGGIVNFLAVLLVSPLFVGPLVALVGWLPAQLLNRLPGRHLGVPARLGALNARRHPGRTAITTAALMIGVGLMASASVAVATVQTTATKQITTHYPIDYILRPADTGQRGVGVPVEVSVGLRGHTEFAGVAQVRLDRATLDGQRTELGTIDPSALRTIAKPEILAGTIDGLRPGTAVLFDGVPETRGRRVGDRVTVASSDGRSGTFTVIAIAKGPSQTGNVMVNWTDFATLHPTSTDDEVLVKAAHGVSPMRSRDALDAVLADFPAVQVGTLADWRAEITNAVQQMISVVAALLAFAILIALIGIMNTLSLSVFERTRESAIERALGLTRGQLRATLIVEALLMALVGALVGVGFGLLYGWATTAVMFVNLHPVLTIPVPQMLAYIALAAAAGAVAAALPARRAARASIVAAMAET